MVLATHAVIGGAVASIAGTSSGVSFILGFFSHFILDAFPHWDYFRLLSSPKAKKGNLNDFEMPLSINFFKDLTIIFLDCFFGFMLLVFFLPEFSFNVFLPIFFGAVGAVLPDFLQFVYFKFKNQPITFIKKIHDYFHSNEKIDNLFFGILIQVILIIGALLIINI